MIEFNADGSIKIPESIAKIKKENEEKLVNQRCIKIEKNVVSFDAPKKCNLHLTLSKKFSDNKFVNNIYYYFKEKASTPSKIKNVDEKSFEIEIGFDFKRCTDCTSLINKYRDFLDGNIIEEQGNCLFEKKTKNFNFEDYFE